MLPDTVGERRNQPRNTQIICTPLFDNTIGDRLDLHYTFAHQLHYSVWLDKTHRKVANPVRAEGFVTQLRLRPLQGAG